MTTSPKFRLPTAVQMPLRDIARGLSSAADMGEHVLDPLVQALPAPVRSNLKEALRRLEDAGAEIIDPDLSQNDIRAASDFLNGYEWPGLPVDASDTDQRRVDETLLAILVWLLADRAESLEGEVQLLDMAVALVRAYSPEIPATKNDVAPIATLLRSLSDHL